MIEKRFGLVLALAYVTLASSAQAVTMEFSFQLSVNAKVVPVTQVLPPAFGDYREPYIDPDAAQRRLNGPSRLTIGGKYDSAQVRKFQNEEYVYVPMTFTSDVFGTIIVSDAALLRTDTGEVAIEYQLPGFETYGPTGNDLVVANVFADTVIKANLVSPRGPGGIKSLTQEGGSLTTSSLISNLYGIQPYLDEPYLQYDQIGFAKKYKTYGADKLDSSEDILGIGRNAFNLYVVPGDPPPIPGGIGTVPEPSAWIMMVVGFGAVAAAMRRRNVSFPIS